MEIIHGKATGLSQETKITGANTAGTQLSAVTQMHSHNELNFRIENKPVVMKLDQTVNVLEGETVAVAGHFKNGVMNGYAIQNQTTGVLYAFNQFKLMVLIAFALIAGLFGITMVIVGFEITGTGILSIFSILLGFIFCFLGFKLGKTCVKYFRASTMLKKL